MGDLISELDHYFPEVDGRMPPLRVTAGADPIAKVTLHKHEVVPNCGRFEVRFHDGRDSVFFYWDDIPGRRLEPGHMDSATALEAAKALAKAERDKASGGL